MRRQKRRAVRVVPMVEPLDGRIVPSAGGGRADLVPRDRHVAVLHVAQAARRPQHPRALAQQAGVAQRRPRPVARRQAPVVHRAARPRVPRVASRAAGIPAGTLQVFLVPIVGNTLPTLALGTLDEGPLGTTVTTVASALGPLSLTPSLNQTDLVVTNPGTGAAAVQPGVGPIALNAGGPFLGQTSNGFVTGSNGFLTVANGFLTSSSTLGASSNGFLTSANGFVTLGPTSGSTLNGVGTTLNGLGTNLNSIGSTLNGFGSPFNSLGATTTGLGLNTGQFAMVVPLTDANTARLGLNAVVNSFTVQSLSGGVVLPLSQTNLSAQNVMVESSTSGLGITDSTLALVVPLVRSTAGSLGFGLTLGGADSNAGPVGLVVPMSRIISPLPIA